MKDVPSMCSLLSSRIDFVSSSPWWPTSFGHELLGPGNEWTFLSQGSKGSLACKLDIVVQALMQEH